MRNGGGRTESRRENLQGLTGTLSTKREKKGGILDGGRGCRNRLAARGRRDQQGPGEKAEGRKTVSAGTGGGGRREWTFAQVDRWSKTGRG